jgi:HAAS domain-containing protein
MTTDDYLKDVSLQLRDLPWKVRRELVSELKGHISELPTGTSFRQRLGG